MRFRAVLGAAPELVWRFGAPEFCSGLSSESETPCTFASAAWKVPGAHFLVGRGGFSSRRARIQIDVRIGRHQLFGYRPVEVPGPDTALPNYVVPRQAALSKA